MYMYILHIYTCDMHTQKRVNVCTCQCMLFSCQIFPHRHTTIMLLGGNIGLVLLVGIVVCRELPSHII